MSQPTSIHNTTDGLNSKGVRQNRPATDTPVGGLQLGNESLDVAAVAKKMNCHPNLDSVCTAIDILVKNVDDLRNKVAFFEKLFGFPAEYLMIFHQNELKKLDNIIFMGQQKLEGEALRQNLMKKTGKEVTLEMLKDKKVIEVVDEAHYEFAVVLPKHSKQELDRKIRQVQEEDAKSANAKKAAVREAQDVVMTEDDPPEKDVPTALQQATSQHSIGPAHRRRRAIVSSDEEDQL